MPDELKTCSKCHQAKAEGEYHKHIGCKGGINSRCKQCVHEYDKLYYSQNREAMLERCIRNAKQKREKANEIKKSLCLDLNQNKLISELDIQSKYEINGGNLIFKLVKKTAGMKNPKEYVAKVLDEVRAIYVEAV